MTLRIGKKYHTRDGLFVVRIIAHCPGMNYSMMGEFLDKPHSTSQWLESGHFVGPESSVSWDLVRPVKPKIIEKLEMLWKRLLNKD